MSLKHTLSALAVGSTLASADMAHASHSNDTLSDKTSPIQLKAETEGQKFAEALWQNAVPHRYRDIIEKNLKNGVNPKNLILGLAREDLPIAQEVLAQSLKDGTLKYDIQQICPKSLKEYTSLKQCGFDPTKEVLGYGGKKIHDNNITAAIEQDVFNRTYHDKHLKSPPKETVALVHAMMKDGVKNGGQKFFDECQTCLNKNPEWRQALLDHHNQTQALNAAQLKQHRGR